MTNPVDPKLDPKLEAKPKRSITTAAMLIGFAAGVLTVILLVRLYRVLT